MGMTYEEQKAYELAIVAAKKQGRSEALADLIKEMEEWLDEDIYQTQNTLIAMIYDAE